MKDASVGGDATTTADSAIVSDGTAASPADGGVTVLDAGSIKDGASSSSDASAKKGVGLAGSSGYGDTQLHALGAVWYYDWGASPVSGATLPFVPMVFSPADVTESITGPIVLGFNEPDNVNQANVSVDAAILAWPQVVAKAATVGAPAMAGNPVTGTWFPAFMDAGPKVDFVPIHWYKGVDSTKFISDVTAVIDAYQRPVWVTEFAPQTAAESAASPTAYTQAQVDAFIVAVVAWMEQQSAVQRYAWHDSKVGTSALYDADGGLTATGLSYAAAR